MNHENFSRTTDGFRKSLYQCTKNSTRPKNHDHETDIRASGAENDEPDNPRGPWALARRAGATKVHRCC